MTTRYGIFDAYKYFSRKEKGASPILETRLFIIFAKTGSKILVLFASEVRRFDLRILKKVR